MARELDAIAVLAVIAGALWTFRVQRLRQLARDRLNESMEGLEAAVSAVEITPTLRRHYIIPWIFAAMFGAILYLGFQLGPVYCVAITVIACSMSSASALRHSPTMMRSGRMRSEFLTRSRMPISPRPSIFAGRDSRRTTCG